MQTLRHLRYPEIFALAMWPVCPRARRRPASNGRCRWSRITSSPPSRGARAPSTYNGYTSCPMITRIGRAMLVEFDYDNNLTPSFPGVIAPLEELWISWLMKEVALKATYNAMLRGRA
jgi:sulfide:quinone oxidoreductase